MTCSGMHKHSYNALIILAWAAYYLNVKFLPINLKLPKSGTELASNTHVFLLRDKLPGTGKILGGH